MSTVGRKLLSALVHTKDLNAMISMGLNPTMFRDSEVLLYNFMTEHIMNYGVIPAQETIEEKLGSVLTSVSEPAEFYLDEVERRFLHTKMKTMIVEAGDILKTEDPEKAFTLAMSQLMELSRVRNRHNLHDFKDAAVAVYQTYVNTKSMPDNAGLMFGWPSLDATTGGLVAGDFCGIVGRPAAGKTFKVLHMANHGWETQNQVPLIASLEMNSIILQQRLAAMSAHKPLTHLLKGMMTTKAFKQVMEKLEENSKKQNSCWILDSNMASTVDDLVLLCRQLKPSALFVDGAYMLKHPDRRLDKFARIGENADLMKQRIAADLGIPVVASYQLGRSAAKKKKGKKNEEPEDGPVGIEDIYGSDVIGQVASIVLGLLQADSVETKMHREVSVLKGRNGEVGKFKINWDFNHMDFSEVEKEKEQQGEMQYLG